MNEMSVTMYQPTQRNILEDLNIIIYCHLWAYSDSIFQASIVIIATKELTVFTCI
jgi:hypothetical protein